MQRKRRPILQNLLKIALLVAKLKKPSIPNLVLLKKSSFNNKLNLLQHYNNGYIKEYQFSPSSSSNNLINCYRKPFKKRSKRDALFSSLFLCQCLGKFSIEGEIGSIGDFDSPVKEPLFATELQEISVDEDTVDERAERFIQRFYQEMKMQRQEPLLQIMGW